MTAMTWGGEVLARLRDETLEAIELAIAPVLSQHRNAIFLNEPLFRRIEHLHRQRDALTISTTRP